MTPASVIMDMIATRVERYNNESYSFTETEKEKYKNITLGMLICLKHIQNDNNVYALDMCEDRIEFGYYDDKGLWEFLVK